MRKKVVIQRERHARTKCTPDPTYSEPRRLAETQALSSRRGRTLPPTYGDDDGDDGDGGDDDGDDDDDDERKRR